VVRGRIGVMEFYFQGTDKDILILSADGGLNSRNADQFVDELQTLVDAGARKLIVDCTRLSTITSYGVGVLIRLHKKLAETGGEVKIAAVDSPIIKVLRLLRLDTVFEIYNNSREAREAFAKGA
jgi:anti-sigma B factor antagonist